MALDHAKLTTRAATAFAGMLILAVFLFFLPKIAMHLLMAILGFFGLREFERIAKGFQLSLYLPPIYAVFLFGLASIYLDFIQLSWTPYLLILLCGLYSLLPPNDLKNGLPRLGLSLVAGAYLILSIVVLGHIFAIGNHEQPLLGRYLVSFFLLLVWLGDSAAYLAGSIFGKHLIAPKTSPKKTYEGTFANFVGNALAGLIAKLWFLPELNYLDIAVLTLIFGFLGFYGDIIESAWKRGSNIKDSGSIFPGHGGILDRIDSVFLTAPLFYWYIQTFVLS